jgi:hypothetical protein
MQLEFKVSEFLQLELRKRGINHVKAVEAAQWLDAALILGDSKDRPGRELRVLLRAGNVVGSRQELNGRWFIDRIGA